MPDSLKRSTKCTPTRKPSSKIEEEEYIKGRGGNATA